MKRKTQADGETIERQSHAPSFAKVLDGRKQPIRGLWVRNGRYYAQLRFEDGTSGEKKPRRVPLLDNADKLPVQTAPAGGGSPEPAQDEPLGQQPARPASLPEVQRLRKDRTWISSGRAGQRAGDEKARYYHPGGRGALNTGQSDLGGSRLDKVNRGISTPTLPSGWNRRIISAR